MTTPATLPATSAELTELWKKFTEVDGTSVVGAKEKEAVKAAYDALSKASEEISQVVEAYRKAYLQLADQVKAFDQFVADPRYTDRVSDARETQIDEAIEKYLKQIWNNEEAISKPGYENDLEEQAHKQTVVFEGMKKHPELIQRWFDALKGEQKQVEARHKHWAELREKAEKAYAEQKYERAYFYVSLLWQRVENQKKVWGEDKAPITPGKLREELYRRWKWLFGVLHETLAARVNHEKASSALDQARKRVEQLNKTGVDAVIRDLDLDDPAGPPAEPSADDAAKKAASRG